MDTKTPQIATATDKLDQELARSAIEKIKRGETPTTQEQRTQAPGNRSGRTAALAVLRHHPQKHWRQMSGRQAKVINEQAQLYGLPFGGAVVNLPDVVRALHDLLAEKGRRLLREDDDMLLGDSNSPALERYREEMALLARLDRLEREGVMVRKDEVRDGLGRISARLRGAGETLERQFGRAALHILHEALDDVERDIERSYASGSNGHVGDQRTG